MERFRPSFDHAIDGNVAVLRVYMSCRTLYTDERPG